MKLLALLLSVALVVRTEDSFVTRKDLVAQSSSQGIRIIAGEPAAPGQFPWQVAVYYRRPSGGLFFCGGSLISDRFVLTAAHCAADASEFSLHFGGNRLNANEEGSLNIDLPGQAAVVHPFYNPVNLNNDLALIELPEPIFFNDRISPIRLPQPGEILQIDSELSVSGWGVTETSSSIVNDLLFTFVHTISNLQCAAVFGTSVIIDSTVCTQGRPVQSPCNGDSGGPLVSYAGPEPTLVGVISFVHRDGCSSGQPAGYVRVESQLQFINEVISVPELPPPGNPEDPPPPEDPEQPPPENPEEPPPPEDPEQPPPENPEEPPPPPPEDPEQPPPENPEEPPPPENPEQPPPENPEEPPPPENPEEPPPPQNPEDPELPPPENPEEPPPPQNPEDPELPPPENPEEPPPPQNPEDPELPPPENPEEPPPPENPEQPPPEDPIPDYIMYRRV